MKPIKTSIKFLFHISLGAQICVKKFTIFQIFLVWLICFLRISPDMFSKPLLFREYLEIATNTYTACISLNPPHIYMFPKAVLAPSWICLSDRHFKKFRLKLHHIQFLIPSFLIPLSLFSSVYYFHFHGEVITSFGVQFGINRHE